MKKFLGWFILGSAFGALGATACGSSSDSGGGGQNYQQLCVELCQKYSTCHNLTVDCNQTCTSQVSSCSNQSAASSKANECLSKSCGTDLDTCEVQIGQACGGSTGSTTGQTTASSTATNGGNTGLTGATTGTTGATTGANTGVIGGLTTTTSGTTGANGSTTGTPVGCDICTRADACCVAASQIAGEDAGACTLKSSCDSAGANQSIVAQECQQIVTTAAGLIPGCQ